MALILFVDDEPDTLQTYQKAVELFGHQAILAATGREGLRMAASESPNLIFVDMMLPDMDGIETIRHLRKNKHTAHLPVVMLSAGPEMDVAEHARIAGAQAYLLKPVRLNTLMDFISKYSLP
jgi:CheY-like chemotaxis protein